MNEMGNIAKLFLYLQNRNGIHLLGRKD
jgi:hypothetical protein